jgi:hypothetical protein
MRFIVRSLRQLRRRPRDWLMRHRDDGFQLVRVSIAAALSWLICEWLLSDTTPVLAPLTAILCGQVTVYRSVRTALQRAAGVIVGVLLAFAVAHGLGLHSWSVGLVTAAALLIGATLRLRSESAEIAVSALLVLAVGSAPQFAADRILESLIGGAVGVAINFVLVPSVYVRSADRRLAELAGESADLLAEIGEGLGREWHRDDARNWLTRARGQSDDIVGARETLDRAEESLRYNPRRHRAPGSVDHLRSGLDSLEHAAALVRSIARTLLDVVESASEGTPHQAGLNPEYATFLRGAADAMHAFGEAVSDPLAPTTSDRVAGLRGSVEAARAVYPAALNAMGVDPQAEPATWSSNGSLINAGGRLLREMDPDAGPHADAFRPEAPPPPLEVLRPPAEMAMRPVRRLRTADSRRRRRPRPHDDQPPG